MVCGRCGPGIGSGLGDSRVCADDRAHSGSGNCSSDGPGGGAHSACGGPGQDRVEAGLSATAGDEPAGRADSADGTGASGDARAADGARLRRCLRMATRDRETRMAARTSRWTVGCIRRCCGSTRWDTWTQAYLAMRPYTRRSALHMLRGVGGRDWRRAATGRRRRFWRRC